MVIRGAIKINDTPTSGTGDPILTRDASAGTVGYVASIDSSTFIPTTLTSGYILVGNGSNVAAGVAVTGDITVSNAGVVGIASGVIVNGDINASAAIAVSKLAALTASRAVATDASGFISATSVTSTELGYVSGVTSAIQTQLNAKQATITGGATSITSSNLTVSRALVSDGSGKVSVSAATSTEVGYLSGVSSALQTQLNNKQAGIQFKDEGVNAGTSGAVTAVDFVGAGVTASHSGGTLTVTIAGTANGLPTGGTAGQVLIKNSGTNYDASFADLTLSDVTDVTATYTQVNALATGYYDATSSVQTQLDSKMSNALTHNYMFRGNVSNVATAFATGSNGQYLSSVGGVPTWSTPAWTETQGGTGETSYTTGDILYASASNTLSKLGIGSTGQVLTISGGVPAWSGYTHQTLRANIAGGATLRAIGSTPQTILAAPGSNKVYNILSVLVSYKYGTTVYDFNGADTIQLRQGSTVYQMTASILNSGSSLNYQMYKTTSTGGSSTNTALTFGCSIDATTGDGDIDIIVHYTTEDINT